MKSIAFIVIMLCAAPLWARASQDAVAASGKRLAGVVAAASSAGGPQARASGPAAGPEGVKAEIKPETSPEPLKKAAAQPDEAAKADAVTPPSGGSTASTAPSEKAATTATKETEEGLVVESGVDHAGITTADTLTFTVTLRYPEGVKVTEMPAIGPMIQGFRITDFGKMEPETKKGVVHESQWFKLAADVSGSYVLPALTVRYLDAKNEKKSAATNEIFVEVTAPAAAAADKKGEDTASKDIRDIKPLMPQDLALLWTLIGGGLAALALTGVALYLVIQRRKRRVMQAPSVPPHEKALASLTALREGQELAAGDVKKFHFMLSYILRQYFEERTGYPATDRTIEEIKRGMRTSSQFAAPQKEEFVRILAQADLVKFTDYDARKGENLHLLMDAIKFVGETAPIAAVEPQGSVI